MFEPTNEQGVIVLFAQQAQQAGIEIVKVQTQYPDAIIKKDGQNYRAEFEFEALNFRAHAHDPVDCDLIICWVNNWPDSPLPVMALSDSGWENVSLNFNEQVVKTIAYWKNRALEAEEKLNSLGVDYDPVSIAANTISLPQFSEETLARARPLYNQWTAEGKIRFGAALGREVGVNARNGRKLVEYFRSQNGHTNGHGGEQ